MAGNRHLPLTKQQHKRVLFKTLQDAAKIGVQYAELWMHEPSERGFIDFIDDILTSLPPTEEDVPQSAYLIFTKMAKRTEECPLRIVENIPERGVLSTPAQLVCSDGTSSLIEQVPCGLPKLPKLSSAEPFEIVSNAHGTLPPKVPFIATFTPATPVKRKDFFLRGVSCEVKANGDLDIEDAPPILAPEHMWPSKTGKTDGKKLGAAELAQVAVGSPDSPSMPKCDPPVRVVASLPKHSRSVPQEANLPATNLPATLPSVDPKPVPVQQEFQQRPTSNSRKRTKDKRVTNVNFDTATAVPQPPAAPAAGTIPFPSMKPPHANRPATAPRTVPHHIIPAYRGDHNSVSSPTPPPDVPFNHFLQHPPNSRAGLQRTHAFVHKSHPEIFWTDEFGEPPKPGEKRTIADCLPSASDRPIKPLRRSPRQAGGSELVSASASAAAGPSRLRESRPSTTSVRKGKGKRAREEDDVEEESRPVQRIRANSAGEASSLRFSQRIKAAVVKLTGAF
ncbi:hypothetical protein Hypma_010913 [Hypsizygus marmoreus]|uniref:Uncharacterized protein n=1 Tax=Hypsizygus marmoreus TaxID=39966 RepID=A0A369JNH0_HYPMA|nr:hypothetical protein Hypma_010913 [Hypsizygus marmoreus]